MGRPTGATGCYLTNENAQEKELQRPSALLVKHEVLLKSLPKRPQQETTQALPKHLSQLRHEAFDYLPSTVDINRGAATKMGQIPDLSGPLTIKRDTSKDILTNAGVLVTPQRSVQFANMATSIPIMSGRPADFLEEQTPQIGTPRVPSFKQCLATHLKLQKDLFDNGIGHSLQVAATEFKNYRSQMWQNSKEVIPTIPAWSSSHG